MTKASYTERGKVWSGDIEPVPPKLSEALQAFVKETNWTGGGEIEFIEEIVPSGALRFDADLNQKKRKWSKEMFVPRSSVPTRDETQEEASNPLLSIQPNRLAVDFNPRFPAWIFASAYSGCNLPALLIAAAVQNHTSAEHYTHIKSAENHDTDSDLLSASTSGVSVYEPPVMPQGVAFVRSLIEVPVVHTPHNRVLPRLGGGWFVRAKSKTGRLALIGASSCNIVPNTDLQTLKHDPCGTI